MCKTFPPVYNSAKIIKKNPSRFSRVMITKCSATFLWFTVYIHTAVIAVTMGEMSLDDWDEKGGKKND